MKKTHIYIDKVSIVDQEIRWMLLLDGQNVQVFCYGESRIYTIPEPVIDINVEDEYVFIHVEGKKFYSFKFELNKFLVGDIFSDEGEHLDTFASHVFGED